MTPLQKLLAQAAKRSGVILGVVERDFAQGYLLEALAAEPALSSTLVFKGGTALKKVYFGDAYRFSEDLDFTDEARVNWQEKLGRLTPDLVPVDRVLSDLPGLVADLLGH